MADEQKARIKITREHHSFIEKLIAKVDTYVDEMVSKYQGVINLLCSIPGIDRSCAITIIGTDMSQFGSSKHLCDWLHPQQQRICGKEEVRAHFQSWCLSQACTSPDCTRCGERQESPLLRSEARVHRQAKKQK